MSLAISSLLQLPNTYRAFYGAFPHLHSIQKQVIAPVLQGSDLILQSATGSGKTEAVLAPCIERVIQSGRSQAVIYVVPTRALAIDLERRLAPVLKRLGLQMGVRTGDLKRAGGARPDLLLTTPESLDVTVGSPNADLRAFARRIGVLIIDEVHPLLHTYRGRQLAFLLQRLERRTDRPIQKIALSATLADVDAVIAFFNFRTDAVRMVEPVQREIAPHLVHLKNDNELAALIDDLYAQWDYRKILLFANSRSACDRLFSLLSHQGRFQHVAELHYSNLKPKARQEAERRFRRRSHALCIATSTLELGIDIGDVDGVVLYDPPDSASAFLQRIGRANRREGRTHFWGICRGETAQVQLIQFLGLLRLARKGIVEAPPPRTLPSVLVQQIASCLYEKKRISPAALQELFPNSRDVIADVFPGMVQSGWMRPDRTPGLFRAGWRYRDWFMDRRIWSNFPETEEDYVLEFAGEAIADLPRSVAQQLESGDRVPLVGKRLHIVRVETGERKRVIAQPADHLDDKDVFWRSGGIRVSYEVAQSMRDILQYGAGEQENGLFSRTQKLLSHALAQTERTVLLDNGITVGRTPGGLYRYHTYLGSVGNLILQGTLESDPSARLEDFVVTSDAIGVDCSHRIDFQTLDLPTSRSACRQWAEQRLDALCSLFALNAFAPFLPRPQLIEEVTDFLFDSRIAEAFQHYRTRSSNVVVGDPAVLETRVPEERTETAWIDTSPEVTPLLPREKGRWQTSNDLREAPAAHQPRALTGTIVGAYIHHQQCARWLSMNFIPPDRCPPEWQEGTADWTAQRMEHGVRHEAHVLAHLKTQGDALFEIAATGALKARFDASIAQMTRLIRRVASEPDRSLVLVQAVLMLPSVFEKAFAAGGVGIPDLIRISPSEHGPQLTVGDIKDSRTPYDSQKWQVAFYAYLLKALIAQRALPQEVDVSNTGFLMLRPTEEGLEPHAFDLRPYLDAFPMLLRNMECVLQQSPAQASYRLQPHCATCLNFAACYREALRQEDLQFLPQLTDGALQKFRALNLKTMPDAEAWLNRREPDDPFSPHQRERLTAHLAAMRTHRIGLRECKTRLFPNNLSAAIFIHPLEDPITGAPRALSWRVFKKTVTSQNTWIITSDDEWPDALRDFEAQFLNEWTASVSSGDGPHVFYFGERSWQTFRAWAENTSLAFLWAPGRTHRTDLRRIIAAHFDLPAPGNLTLFALSHLLGLSPEPDAPESLFHLDAIPYFSTEEWAQNETRRREAVGRLEAQLTLQTKLWAWASAYLESEWEQRQWDVTSKAVAPETAFLNFLDEEKRLREEDVLALQAYNLEERVARFRSLGPLQFQKVLLDEEGHFRYEFQMPQEAGLSKFREGDFLKLALVGERDLQSGLPVILADYDRRAGRLQVQSRKGRLALNRRCAYSLEEDLTDWNGPKLTHAVQTVFSSGHPHPLSQLFSGKWTGGADPDALRWVQTWLRTHGVVSGLNSAQQHALSLPFRHRLSMVEGPPGTGKTHVLGWTLIALIQHAREFGLPMRIAVSALTHQAIDQVLQKIATLVNRYDLRDFPAKCLKWGRQPEAPPGGRLQVAPLDHAEALVDEPYAIVGATGFGLYQMYEGRFPDAFDWIVFDEASQVLIPQALLSLLHGKGRFLFSGDVQQLPPVVQGTYDDAFCSTHRSVLAHLLAHYGPEHRIRLNRTYRMNEAICNFPSRTWYDGELRPAPENAKDRLVLPGFQKSDLIDHILDPESPVALVIADHMGCHQQSEVEVEIASTFAARLMTRYGLPPEQLALISPHRAQNNAIAGRLIAQLGEGVELPLIDTVERVQGAERDVILFTFTTSDADYIESEFLNNPNRFNVAITRAKKKLIVVGSRAFFSTVPPSEDALKANRCFKAFYEYCRKRNSLFVWEEETQKKRSYDITDKSAQ